jgi:hypothetical protein
MHTWSARVCERNAKDTRELVVKLKAGADELDARIKHVADMGKAVLAPRERA